MGQDGGNGNKRRHERYPTDKRANLRDGKRHRTGTVTDISAGGLAMDLDSDMDPDGLGLDDPVDLDVEDMSELTGQVARTFDDGLAVQFDLDEMDESRIVDEIMNSVRGVDAGD